MFTSHLFLLLHQLGYRDSLTEPLPYQFNLLYNILQTFIARIGELMLPRVIRIKGFTRENRYGMIDYAVSSISKCSGWVTNHTMYANKMIVINFEIEVKGVRELLHLFNQNGLVLSEESIELLNDFPEDIVIANKDKEIIGSINITFVNDEPTTRNHIPAIPG